MTSMEFRLDARRWTPGDRITGIATLVLLISLFLPWYGVDILGIGAEVDGLTGHGYLYIVLISCLAVIAYLGMSAGFEELPARLPLSHRQRLLAATGLNAALVMLAFLVKPGFSGWRYGAFAAVIAAVGAVVPLIVPARQPAAPADPTVVSRRGPGETGEWITPRAGSEEGSSSLGQAEHRR